jgi:hypothetical protein
MGYDLTVQGLIRKRAELAGQVEAMNAQLTATLAQLHALDSAIRVFKPDIDLDDLPCRSAAAPFTGFRGEIQRFLLDRLREANAPQSTFDLADAVMDKRGLDRSDKIATNLIRKRTGYALAKLRKAGRVTSSRSHRSAPLEWRLC